MKVMFDILKSFLGGTSDEEKVMVDMIINCVSVKKFLFVECCLLPYKLQLFLTYKPVVIIILFSVAWIISKRIYRPLLQSWICKFSSTNNHNATPQHKSLGECLHYCLLCFRINVWIIIKPVLGRNWPVLKSSLVTKNSLLVTRSVGDD